MDEAPFAPVVRLLTRSGAYLKQRAAALLRGMSKNGQRRTLQDGYLILLRRYNRQREAKVVDPEAYLLMAGRQRTGNGTSDQDPTFVEAHHPLYALPTGRDPLYFAEINTPTTFSMPVTTAEPYAYQRLGNTVPSTPPNEPHTSTDFTGRLAGSLDLLPGQMALATSFVFHTSTSDSTDIDAAEIRLELMAPALHRTVYRLGEDNKTVIVDNPEAGGLVGTGSLRLGQGQFGDHDLVADARAGGNGVGWATGTLQRIDQGVGYAAVATQRAQVVRVDNEDNVIPHLWIGQAQLRAVGTTVVGHPIDNPVMSDADPVRGGAISGGQWVRLGDEAVSLVGYTGYVGSTYPCAVYAYRLSAQGAMTATQLQRGIWLDEENHLHHELSPLIIGGCAADGDLYFLASSPIESEASYLRLFRLGAGGLVLLQQFFRVYPSAWHTQFSRGSHLAYLGNRKLVFVYANQRQDTTNGLLVNLKLATFNLDTGAVAALADPGVDLVITVWHRSMLLGTPVEDYTSTGASLFCGGFDVLRPEQVDSAGNVTQQAILLFTMGGLGTFNARMGAVGTTWISYDSGASWEIFANAGSGVSTRYVGNLLQFRT